jgi:hypothetical protein
MGFGYRWDVVRLQTVDLVVFAESELHRFSSQLKFFFFEF